MFLLLGMLFLVFLFFLNHWKRTRITHKIYNMRITEKCELLNKLIQPYGYSYIFSHDIFTSCADAWKPEKGDCSVFNQTASRPSMVFDTLPVYFNYADRTWLIKFSKGQSGISAIGRIDVYYADHILGKCEKKHTQFQRVGKESILKLSFTFYEKKIAVAQLSAEHWCLAICKTGCFYMPSDLSMQTSISFPSYEMAKAFAEGLVSIGYPCNDVCIYRQTVSFTFGESILVSNPFRRLRNKVIQYCNCFGFRVYCFLTHPFCLSVDRILYLYYYMPFTLHKIFQNRG